MTIKLSPGDVHTAIKHWVIKETGKEPDTVSIQVSIYDKQRIIFNGAIATI